MRTAERQELVDFLANHGINANRVLRDGFDQHGYRQVVLDENGQHKIDPLDGGPLSGRVRWPEDFPYGRFEELVEAVRAREGHL